METSKQILKPRPRVARDGKTSGAAERCRRKFIRFSPGGFRDETYLDWERGYKWEAHDQWNEVLSQPVHRELLRKGEFAEIAARAVRRVSHQSSFLI